MSKIKAKSESDIQIERFAREADENKKELEARRRDGYVRKVDKKIPYYGMIYIGGPKEILVNPERGDLLNTIIHEEMHRKHPSWTEKQVYQRSGQEERKLTINKAIKLLTRFIK